MKKHYFVPAMNVILLAGLTSISAVAKASETAAPVVQEEQSGGAQKRTPEKVVEALGSKLNLTDDQKTQLTPIIAERQQKLAALKEDTSLRRRQKLRKMKGIFEDSDKKVNAILNDQQKKQYAQLEQEMRQEMKERVRSRKPGTD